MTLAGNRYSHGTIAWTELYAGDAKRQEDFYSRLFGWRFDEQHRPRWKDGALVAALREPRWTETRPLSDSHEGHVARSGEDALRGWVPFTFGLMQSRA